MTKYSLIINPFTEEDIKDSKSWYNLQKENVFAIFHISRDHNVWKKRYL